MHEYNVHEAKTHLSKLIDLVQAGEEVVITRNNRPVIKLTAIQSTRKRKLGTGKGEYKFPEGWEKPMSDQESDEFLEGR